MTSIFLRLPILPLDELVMPAKLDPNLDFGATHHRRILSDTSRTQARTVQIVWSAVCADIFVHVGGVWISNLT